MRFPGNLFLGTEGLIRPGSSLGAFFSENKSSPTPLVRNQAGQAGTEQEPAPQRKEEGNAQPVEAGMCDLGYGLDVYLFPNLFRETHKHKH